METKTPFDLNAATQRWRENLAQSPAFRAENLAELESHLRDSVARLRSTGLSATEAFMVAETRIGSGGVLDAEFSKINRQSIWLIRFFWMLIGIQFWSLCTGVRNAIFFSLSRAGYDFSIRHPLIPPRALFVAGNLALYAGSLVLFWWTVRRKGEVFDRWMARLLHNRAVAIFNSCVLILLSCVIPQLLSMPQKALSHSIETMTFVYNSSLIYGPIQNAVLIALTLYVVAKRYRPVKA